MAATVLSFLFLLAGFFVGIPEGHCAPAGGIRLHLDEHYTGGNSSSIKTQPSPVPDAVIQAGGSKHDELPPERPAPSHRGGTLLVLVGMALVPAAYYLQKKTAGRKVPAQRSSPVPGSSCRTDHAVERPEVPEERRAGCRPDFKEHWNGLEGNEIITESIPEQFPTSPPEGHFSLSMIRGKKGGKGDVDSGRLMILLESVRNPHDYARLLYSIGRAGMKEALPRVLRELAHPHASVRMAAAAALVRLKSDGVEARLIEMVEGAPPQVRRAALLVLSRIGSPRCHEIVRQSNWDFEPEVREAAAIALGRLQVPDSELDLHQILNDFEEPVRKRAVRASEQFCEALQENGR